MNIHAWDEKIIAVLKKISIPFTRFSIFAVFFWFGILKVVGMSPASGLVERLFNDTIPFMSFTTFFIAFGLFECLIGILFLIKGMERAALVLLVVHLITTLGPLVLLPQETWSGFLVPTLEGQYIIKNILIAAGAAVIGSTLIPLGKRGK